MIFSIIPVVFKVHAINTGVKISFSIAITVFRKMLLLGSTARQSFIPIVCFLDVEAFLILSGLFHWKTCQFEGTIGLRMGNSENCISYIVLVWRATLCFRGLRLNVSGYAMNCGEECGEVLISAVSTENSPQFQQTALGQHAAWIVWSGLQIDAFL